MILSGMEFYQNTEMVKKKIIPKYEKCHIFYASDKHNNPYDIMNFLEDQGLSPEIKTFSRGGTEKSYISCKTPRLSIEANMSYVAVSFSEDHGKKIMKKMRAMYPISNENVSSGKGLAVCQGYGVFWGNHHFDSFKNVREPEKNTAMHDAFEAAKLQKHLSPTNNKQS